MIRILLACEESDELRGRLEARGFDAVSCDLKPNRNPNAKHYRGSVFDIINDGWHAMIGFPPCYNLCVSGARWFPEKIKDGRQQESIDFFLALANANIEDIALENPVGIMSNIFRAPDQIIQPYFFGDEAKKTTCLWLKGFPKLVHISKPDLFNPDPTHVGPGEFVIHGGSKKPKWYADAFNLPKEERSKLRSKTFPGIAEAMANQWGDYLINKYKQK